MDSFMKRVATVQGELKAPKNQYNSFGKYKYRSCEDILEAAKPLCVKNGMVLTVNDSVVVVGERYYIKATATLRDTESAEELSNEAFAREENEKKGMDSAQVTGATSSYARKYALNGLFCIDDTKDVDTEEYQQKSKQETIPKEIPKLTCDECNRVILGYKGRGGKEISAEAHIEFTKKNYGKVLCVDCAKKAQAELVAKMEKKDDKPTD